MNSNIKKNKSLFKIIMLIIDIIAIVILVFLFVKWNSNNNDNSDTDYNEVKYKKFTLQIPNQIEYSDANDKNFKLKGNDYEAIVEIFIDEANYMFEKKDKYYQALKSSFDVDNPYEEIINDIPVLIYNKRIDDNSNSLLCYFRINSPFSVEIELINNDGSLKKNALNELVNIMRNSTYDYDSTEKFEYYSSEKDPTFKD